MSRSTPLERLRMLEELGPRRLTGTPLEKKAQEILGAELTSLGYSLEWRPHTWTRSIYMGLMMHFGLGVLGFGLTMGGQPWIGAAVLFFAAVSYFLESMRRALLLRGLFPKIHSQNLIARLPAKKQMRRRIVTIAHCDAAFTGVLFNPTVIRLATKPPPHALRWFGKQLGLATATLFIGGILAVIAALGVWGAPYWVFSLLSIPTTLTFLLNLDVVLRDRVVPGAADNLSGCTASLELAHRVAATPLPDDVELVIVISGSEEAGTGGAVRLAQQVEKSGEWKKEDTYVLGLDTLCAGTLRYLEEGEMWAIDVPAPMLKAIEAVNAKSEIKATKFVVPSGASDSLPFLVRGWNTVCLSCIDPYIGAPRNYHSPGDTWTNIDEKELNSSIDYAEKYLRELANS
ncbi:MAG: M28 family peptidase [Archangium sp.]